MTYEKYWYESVSFAKRGRSALCPKVCSAHTLCRALSYTDSNVTVTHTVTHNMSSAWILFCFCYLLHLFISGNVTKPHFIKGLSSNLNNFYFGISLGESARKTASVKLFNSRFFFFFNYHEFCFCC